MTLIVQEVKTKKELKSFIKFQNKLYRGNANYVPPILDFEWSTLHWEKNPAFDFCEARYWLALQDGEIVGRIAGIVHGAEIQAKPLIRFGWFDFIDDQEVSKILLDEVINWAKSKNLTGIHGPLGFTDLDFEGSLIEGFEHLSTQATIYNYPYYRQHFEAFGFKKAVDWLEIRMDIPDVMPPRLERAANLVANRFKLEIKQFKNAKEILPYANAVFELLNEAYSDLYGYYPLTEKQIKYYVDQYFGFIRKEYVSLVVNEQDEVIAFAITLPSLSKAFRKAKGSLYPFGFIHVLKAFYGNEDLDLFLIGVKPGYQRMGAAPLIFHTLLTTAMKNKVKTCASGPMLENNKNVLNLWNDFEDYLTGQVRRRCYIKNIEA